MNKKANLMEWSSQSVFWVGRMFLTLLFVVIVTAPIGCHSQNKEYQLKTAEQYTQNTILYEIKTCLEKNPEQSALKECIKSKNAGFTITTESSSFVINQDLFQEKKFCDISKDYICRKETLFITRNNELKQFDVDLVVFYG